MSTDEDTTLMPQQTPEQRRAADALRAVPAAQEEEAFRKNYRSYVERFGPSILMNGLGQALASERAAAERQRNLKQRAHFRLYENVSKWLCRPGGVYSDGVSDALDAIVTGPQDDYLRAQQEALAWLVWHKKFCRAALPAPDPSEQAD